MDPENLGHNIFRWIQKFLDHIEMNLCWFISFLLYINSEFLMCPTFRLTIMLSEFEFGAIHKSNLYLSHYPAVIIYIYTVYTVHIDIYLIYYHWRIVIYIYIYIIPAGVRRARPAAEYYQGSVSCYCYAREMKIIPKSSYLHPSSSHFTKNPSIRTSLRAALPLMYQRPIYCFLSPVTAFSSSPGLWNLFIHSFLLLVCLIISVKSYSTV